MKKPFYKRWTHLTRVRVLAFLCGVPGFIGALILLSSGDYDFKAYLTLMVLGGAAWIYFSIRLQYSIIRPLQTASNMLSALREGDFSLHAAYVHNTDPLGQLLLEINLLTDVLSTHRSSAMEANSLLDKVIEEINAAVLTFDPKGKISLSNKYARQLLGFNKDSIQDKTAAEIGLKEALESESNSMISCPSGRTNRRFAVRKGIFRVSGEPYELLILVDVSRTLREEELEAWKKLIRVLGHEINNSMAPIQSIAQSLETIAKLPSPDEEDKKDLLEGLEIIKTRSKSLSRFLSRYAHLAKLPPPNLQPIEISNMIKRVTMLSERLVCQMFDPDDCRIIHVDPDQIEQVLINLIKNAHEAIEDLPESCIEIHWKFQEGAFVLYVDDEGSGIANPDNIFTPFFSTKKSGSGIGLTLSRQIIEGHGGSLSLFNHPDHQGCRAQITLPLT